MPRSRWAVLFIGLFAPAGGRVELGDGMLSVSMGLLGGAKVPVARISRISRMDWPGLGGLGVRIGKGLVAFVMRSGPCVLVELDQEVSVRAPLPWRTSKIVLRVDDPDALIGALARARGAADA